MPYEVVFNSRKTCGLNAWGRFLQHISSTENPEEHQFFLRRILNPPTPTIPTMRSAIDELEADIVEHWSRGQSKPSGETLRAILLAMVPKNLEEQPELNIHGLTLSFLEQTASKDLVDDGDAAPMDLDYGGGHGKGGGLGKPNRSQIRCHTCGKLGNMAMDCWQQSSASSSKGSPSSGPNSKGYPKGAPKGFKDKVRASP